MSPRKTEGVHCGAFEVPLNELRWKCDEAYLGFKSTAEIEPLGSGVFINQPRAEDAIETGLSDPGHLFLKTPDGAITSVLVEKIEKEVSLHSPPEIHDILYVYNHVQLDKPKKMLLPAGKGISFAMSVKKLRDTLKQAIVRSLWSEECLRKRQRILDDFQSQIDEARKKFGNELEAAGLEIEGLGHVRFFIARDRGHDVLDAFGIALINGCALQKGILQGQEARGEQEFWYPYWQVEKFAHLSDEQKVAVSAQIDLMVQDFKVRYVQMMAKLTALSEQSIENTSNARAEFIDMVFRKESAGILKEYGEAVFDFIDMLCQYTIENVENTFLPKDTNNTQHPGNQPHFQPNLPGQDPFLPFEVNVFVDNRNTQGPPIIIDRNPTYERLFGEVVSTPTARGPHFSDHTMIRAGDLSRAEGGYLILPTRAVLADPFIWSRLRAVLESRNLDIGVGAWRTITPESLPVNVRLILVGDEFAYTIFNSHPWLREDFKELFKKVAEFDWEAPRTEEIMRQVAQLIKLFCVRGSLPDVSSDGVSLLLEYALRQAENKARLLLDARSIKKVLNEAGDLARKEAPPPQVILITGKHVSCALEKRIYRADLIREKIHELIKNGTLLTQLEGREVGQINSLVVFSDGDLRFGIPKRITSRTYAGKRGIINIEREVHLSGRLHDKGVFLFEGYLGGKYAKDSPIAFNASISFEQEYAGVEGDSASSTELYAILSSLAELPLRQDIAVTGSVNQKGEIQPIGGVNEKVEGFFDVCSLFGLTGTQGVIIPHRNVQNLMLRQDVIDAVKDGKFRIYAIKTIEEGMEILTGKNIGEKIKSGERKGQYPNGTINYLVEKRLKEFARAVQQSQSG